MAIDKRIRLQIPGTDATPSYFSVRPHQGSMVDPATYSMPGKVLFLTGVGGNFSNLQKILFQHKVIDKKRAWIFENGHVFVIGNLMAPGVPSIESMWLLYALEESARLQSGRIHLILSQYDILQLNGSWRKQHPQYARPMAHHKSVNALFWGNEEVGRWMASKSIIKKTGSLLIFHHSILPLLSAWYTVRSLEAVNDNVRKTLPALIFADSVAPSTVGGGAEILAKVQSMRFAKFKESDKIVMADSQSQGVTLSADEKIISIGTSSDNTMLLGLLKKRHRYYQVDSEGGRFRLL